MTREDGVRELIEKISLKDDQRAFRDFFYLYYTRLLKLAYYYVESSNISEEIVSTVFIGIWNNRKKLIDVKRVEAYLFTSVKYKCFSYLRDSKRSDIFSLDPHDEALQSEFRNPFDALIQKELREKVLHVINNLPPRCKLIFELVKDDGLKYREVADLLEISMKSVEAQVSKAMIILRKEIYPYLNDADFNRYLNRMNKNRPLFFFFL